MLREGRQKGPTANGYGGVARSGAGAWGGKAAALQKKMAQPASSGSNRLRRLGNTCDREWPATSRGTTRPSPRRLSVWMLFTGYGAVPACICLVGELVACPSLHAMATEDEDFFSVSPTQGRRRDGCLGLFGSGTGGWMDGWPSRRILACPTDAEKGREATQIAPLPAASNSQAVVTGYVPVVGTGPHRLHLYHHSKS